jgi:hypothetical protein
LPAIYGGPITADTAVELRWSSERAALEEVGWGGYVLEEGLGPGDGGTRLRRIYGGVGEELGICGRPLED